MEDDSESGFAALRKSFELEEMKGLKTEGRQCAKHLPSFSLQPLHFFQLKAFSLRWLTVTVLVVLAMKGEELRAQDSDNTERGPCPFLHPSPQCTVFALTNVGYYIYPGTDFGPADHLVFDWGFMLNRGSRNALGGSWRMALCCDDHFIMGPMIRYRRWITEFASVDIGVGTNIGAGDSDPGGVIALIKFNHARWLGVGVESEIVRTHDHQCSASSCTFGPATNKNIRVGVELGAKPGFATTLGTIVAGAVLAVIIIGLVGAD